MVTKKQLLEGRKYKFEHIEIKVVEEDADSNVLVFCATFVKTALPGKLSKGSIEINETLWNSGSSKRPPGYWVLGGSENNGIETSYFVSDEWLEANKGVEFDSKKALWGIA